MANNDCPVCEIMFAKPFELKDKFKELEEKREHYKPSKMTKGELIKQNKRLREINYSQVGIIWSHRIELKELRAENLELKREKK